MSNVNFNFVVLIMASACGSHCGRKREDIIGHQGWVNAPVPFCFRRRHDLAVVVEDHPRRRMAHFQGELRCVLMLGEVIGGERMPQPVVRPTSKSDLRGEVPSGDVIGPEALFPDGTSRARVRP
jgi:hypothetical protein